MFSERKLIRLSLLTIIIGLTGLYFIGLFVDPEFVEIDHIDENMAGKVISTEGTISKIAFIEKSKTLFLDIKGDEKTLKIIIFNSERDLFKKGDEIILSGELATYKGKLELIARDIEKI
ncbi:MAG: OB-fold nucleic acid binding domain-containing protein [Candidatus Aenigmarchaeota archaeon]|nr:OB-fold nucleic acid binding domain-containing protein [Candidatus Aenigmarchaeota archaeon]